MEYNGFVLPEKMQEKYRNQVAYYALDDFNIVVMGTFCFKGPIVEMDKFEKRLHEKKIIDYHKRKMDKKEKDEVIIDLCYDDKDLLVDFPMLKATGFVMLLNELGWVASAGVVYKESGFSLPTQYHKICDYSYGPDRKWFSEPIPSGTDNIGKYWPICQKPTFNFRTRYQDSETEKRSISYVFPFAEEWNDKTYVFEYDNEIYQYSDLAAYVINDDVLCKFCGHGKDIAVSNKINVIGEAAFENNDEVISVFLPDLKTIERRAFYGCTRLKHVFFKKSVLRIESEGFAECPHLTELIIPDGVEYIAEDALFRSGVEKVAWPKSISTIPAGFFRECRNLYEVYIPKTVTDIGRRVFNRSATIIIIGEPGSYAEEYAKENGFYFRAED